MLAYGERMQVPHGWRIWEKLGLSKFGHWTIGFGGVVLALKMETIGGAVKWCSAITCCGSREPNDTAPFEVQADDALKV